jgi:hypothetical protein
MRSALLLAGLAVTVSACVSMDYGPITDKRPYGYAETPQADGSYVLRVFHPDATLAMNFWDQRAGELCGSTNFVKNIYVANRQTLLYSNYGGMAGAAVLEGTLTCKDAATAAPAAAS